MRPIVPLAVAVFAVASAVGAQGPVFVQLDPRATYLRRYPTDVAPDAMPIDLAALGVTPGQFLRLRGVGDFDNGPGSDVYVNRLAIFSASATLLPADQLARVADAIDSGCDVVSSRTWRGDLPTDVPEDFAVRLPDFTEVAVQVPPGATHLFVTAHDSLFYDNGDPDQDFGIELVPVAPPSWTGLGGGVGGALGEPALTGAGALVCGTDVVLDLSGAAPNTPAALVLGATRVDLPLFGGVLVPDPVIADLFGVTDAAGRATMRIPFRLHVDPAAEFYFQVWLPDPTAPFGLAASGGLRAIAP